jgi:hypothetical protein
MTTKKPAFMMPTPAQARAAREFLGQPEPPPRIRAGGRPRVDKPKTNAQCLADSQSSLERSGGRRFMVNLRPADCLALDKLRAAWGQKYDIDTIRKALFLSAQRLESTEVAGTIRSPL